MDLSQQAAKPKAVAVADIARQAADLRISGLSYRDIGRALDVSHVTARNYVIRTYQELGRERKEALREMFWANTERCERVIARMMVGVQQGDTKAADTMLRAIAELNRMWGLHAPQELHIEAKTQSSLNVVIANFISSLPPDIRTGYAVQLARAIQGEAEAPEPETENDDAGRERD